MKAENYLDNLSENMRNGEMEAVKKQLYAYKPETMRQRYAVLPFYMEYETKYAKKEKYGDIVKELAGAEKEVSKAGYSGMDTAWYLAALIDVIDNMSFEIYEQYRKLQDIFKQTLAKVLQNSGTDSVSVSEKAMLAYCILKACRMGILLKEKYAARGMEMVESLSGDGQDAEEAEILSMARGQYAELQKELEM